MTPPKGSKTKKGKVLPPEKNKGGGANIDIRALVTHFSERPDLMLDAIERHDKGFVKRTNKRLEEDAKRANLSRFKYNERHAYAVLVVVIIAALCCPLVIVYLAATGMPLSFSVIIGLAIFFAIAQSGTVGFIQIARGIKQLLARGRNNNNDE